jgi:CRISPR/Cas system-associated endoribonuclease Cas2
MLTNILYATKIKNTFKKLKLRLKNTIIDKNFNICIRKLDTNKETEKENKYI